MPRSIHILTKVTIVPINILFYTFYLLTYFLSKKILHIYTFELKMIPIYILDHLKRIPHSSRSSVYIFIMEVKVLVE